MEPEDGAELLQPHGKTLMNGELFLMDEQRTWFFELASISGDVITICSDFGAPKNKV